MAKISLAETYREQVYSPGHLASEILATIKKKEGSGQYQSERLKIDTELSGSSLLIKLLADRIYSFSIQNKAEAWECLYGFHLNALDPVSSQILQVEHRKFALPGYSGDSFFRPLELRYSDKEVAPFLLNLLERKESAVLKFCIKEERSGRQMVGTNYFISFCFDAEDAAYRDMKENAIFMHKRGILPFYQKDVFIEFMKDNKEAIIYDQPC